jgi:hypothetical protein
MIVSDDLGEHRHRDLAGPFPADVQLIDYAPVI